MSAAFTPGPWAHTRSVNCGDVCFDIHQVEIDGKWASGSDVAYTTLFRTYVAEHGDIQVANARLIAAAPELLEALQLLLQEEENGTVCEIDRATARAAIVKATGASA